MVAYWLMPNHAHFVLRTGHEDGLRATTAGTHRRYARMVNLREGWRGHPWQERCHSFVTAAARVRAAIPYVECNPVRAGLCERPADWRWSSASESTVAESSGLVDWRLRARLQDVAGDDEIANAQVDEQIRLHTRTGRPLGPKAFVEALEAATGRVLEPRKAGPRGQGPSTDVVHDHVSARARVTVTVPGSSCGHRETHPAPVRCVR